MNHASRNCGSHGRGGTHFGHALRYEPMLPVIWAVFVILAVGGFLMIAAYWLDVQERPDLSTRARIAWSAAVLLFPISIPAYALAGGPGWPPFLRLASLVPAVALALFAGFVLGIFT